MRHHRLSLILVCGAGLLTSGCGQPRRPAAIAPPAPFSQYRLAGFDWSSIRRVLVMPLWNETSDPHAGEELRRTLASELQAYGVYEVIVPPLDAPPEWSRRVRVHGEFDEMELVQLAQEYFIDTVLCGTVTQAHAYAPPRLGLSLRLISTAEGIVVASVDGLWDARDEIVAGDARAYYDMLMTKSLSAPGPDVVLSSPRLFHKYVCGRVAQIFVGPPRLSPPLSASAAPAIPQPETPGAINPPNP